MKILLSQSEIAQIVQQALVDYASQLVIIPEGSQLSVTMTDDGAVIDLIASGEAKPQVQAQARKAAPAVAKAETPKAETNVKSFAPKKPIVAPVEVEAVVDLVPFDGGVDTAEEAKAETAAPESTEVPEAAPAAAEEAAPPVRSLFANLRKPVN